VSVLTSSPLAFVRPTPHVDETFAYPQEAYGERSQFANLVVVCVGGEVCLKLTTAGTVYSYWYWC
jgi:hypothetical protein